MNQDVVNSLFAAMPENEEKSKAANSKRSSKMDFDPIQRRGQNSNRHRFELLGYM